MGPVPTAIEEALDHVERFCRVLGALEASPQARASGRWLVGRREEIEQVMALLVADWRAGRVSEPDVVNSVHGYLATLHEGVRDRFGEEATVDCCSSTADVTLPMPTSWSRPKAAPPAPEITGLEMEDTIADPEELLQCLWREHSGRGQ